MEKLPNNLINESSPYLLQHLYNPVNWYPWDEHALNLAKENNKMIFLSIGYSACHWCHVMEKESFEDNEIAQLMNDVFINIKVDREERPDIDNIYMTVCQVMNGSGGWPLTVILTPDLKPIFSGTYFPKLSIGNRVGIKDVIIRAKQVWNENRKEILESADEMTSQLNFARPKGNLSEINDDLIRKCYFELLSTFDNINGGFSKKPKFPIPHNFLFLFDYFYTFQEKEALDMALFTLKKMRFGGIYDHVGNGFHRYATDQEWIVPHFEKMIYDQALLTINYLLAYQITNDIFYAKTAEDILSYIQRELLDYKGGFYSSEDADSDGEEGKYYLWNINEIRKTLIGNVELFTNIFNIKENGNYIDEIKGTYNGKNIPYIKADYNELAIANNLNPLEFEKKINQLKNLLFEVRNERTKPAKDDKILTDWNAMTIKAFSKAARILSNESYLKIAENAYKFIKNNLFAADGKLLHRHRNGKSGINAMIDDYAYLISAQLELFYSTSNPQYLNDAKNVFSLAYDELYDHQKGGFFFASKSANDLIIRKKEIYDGAIPSGNSVMLHNMLDLSLLGHKFNYKEIIEDTIKNFEQSIAAVPSAYTFFVKSLIRFTKGSSEIIISGNNKARKKALYDKINKMFLLNTIIINLQDEYEYPDKLNIYIDNEKPLKVIICKDFVCLEPMLNELQVFAAIENLYKK